MDDIFRDSMFYPLIDMKAHLEKQGKAVDVVDGHIGVLQNYLLQVIPNNNTKETPNGIVVIGNLTAVMMKPLS